MANSAPSFTLGIEEEYLLVDRQSLDLASAPDGLMADCVAELGDKVNPEFLRCQIEVGTGVCRTIAEARDDLSHLRRTVARIAGKYGLAPLAVSTHPTAEWDEQRFTEKDRYRELEEDLAAVARRMLICGMHVHVGIDDDDLRIDLMNQFSYFLPHLLALSTSSPFWGGRDTGLKSYRLTVFDNMPRTGIPPVFASFSDYRRAAGVLIDTGIIEDCTKIWWDVRPSDRFPTLESRICDVLPTVSEAIGVAALTQSLFRFLYSLRAENRRWREYDRFLIAENRWRAQRYGVSDSLVDFGKGELVAYGTLLDELIMLLRPHAEALGCQAEVEAVRDMMATGTGADRQLAVFSKLRGEGADEREAMRGVIRSLIDAFGKGI